jgi:hypothetical protein
MSMVQRQIDHTIRVGKMILWFESQGYKVVGKDWHRSAQEQHRIFVGYPDNTKCDGYLKVSSHQNDLSTDFVLMDDNLQPIWKWPIHVYQAVNAKWVELGGKPLILWDKGHLQSP